MLEETNPLFADTHATDVNQRLAIVVPWPSEESLEEAVHEISQLVTEVVKENLHDIRCQKTTVSCYQVGPAATGLIVHYLCTIYRDVRPFLNDGASLIAWAGLAVALYRRLRVYWQQRRRDMPYDLYQTRANLVGTLSPLFSEPMVLGLCYRHCAQSYSESIKDISIYDRSALRVFSSASHPGGDEIYTVRIWTLKRRCYVYVVDSRGSPIEHFLISGKTFQPLDLPRWFNDESVDTTGFSEVRSISVSRV